MFQVLVGFDTVLVNYTSDSPGDARYTCYRYSIYVFGIFTWFITGTIIDGDPSIKQLWQPFKIDGEPVTGLPGDSRTVRRIAYKKCYGVKMWERSLMSYGQTDGRMDRHYTSALIISLCVRSTFDWYRLSGVEVLTSRKYLVFERSGFISTLSVQETRQLNMKSHSCTKSYSCHGTRSSLEFFFVRSSLF